MSLGTLYEAKIQNHGKHKFAGDEAWGFFDEGTEIKDGAMMAVFWFDEHENLNNDYFAVVDIKEITNPTEDQVWVANL